MKTALCNLISGEEVVKDSNPLEAFSKGLLHFHSCYCKDQHDSPWCKFHSKTNYQEVQQSHALQHYPVLVAHNGFVFDFLIMLSELHRRNIPFDRSAALHFADMLYDCKKHAKDSNSTIFVHWDASGKRLGIGNLYSKYFVDLQVFHVHVFTKQAFSWCVALTTAHSLLS